MAEDHQEVDQDRGRERAEQILKIASSVNTIDLIARLALWPTLSNATSVESRNDQVSGEPLADYLVCLLVSHSLLNQSGFRPAITPLAFYTLLELAARQMTAHQDRPPQPSKVDLDAQTIEARLASARQNLELLASMEQGRSVVVRFPIEPILWRGYLADIYGPIEAKLSASLGFSLATIVKVRNVILARVERYMHEAYPLARTFVDRATDIVKRMRRGRRVTIAIGEAEQDVIAEFAQMRPSESRKAIDRHAVGQILDGALALLRIKSDDPDLIAATGVDQLNSLLDAASLTANAIEAAEYVKPNPSPEVHLRPFVQVGEEHIVFNPTTFDYFADGIIWGCGGQAQLEKAIAGRRSAFTEARAAEVLGLVFGADAIHRGLRVIDLVDGHEIGELDVLVVTDIAIIAVECKSTRWSRSAQRGSRKRIERDMTVLYDDPLHQLGDRINRLRASEKVALVNRRHEVLNVNWTTPRKHIGLVVHLEPIDSIQASPALVPVSDHESSLDSLLLCGLPYLEIACRTLHRSSALVDYIVQRSRLSKDRTLLLNDENDWLALYLDTGLRYQVTSSMGFHMVTVGSDTRELDRFVRSGFDASLRPNLPVIVQVQPILYSIGDARIQLLVTNVLLEQDDLNKRRLAHWVWTRGCVDAANPTHNSMLVIYSADGTIAVALFMRSDRSRAVLVGEHVERCRGLMNSKPNVSHCILVVTEAVAGEVRTRDVLEVQAGLHVERFMR
jgi:hypothetical protein